MPAASLAYVLLAIFFAGRASEFVW